MKKCIVVSDSFKGTLSSQEICTLAAQRLEAYFPGCEVVRIPVADGGEGTVACFHEACGGTLVSVPVSGPYGEAITAEYLQLPGGQAVIEMASAAGLPQVENRKDPCKTTTYGVGQLIRHAVEAVQVLRADGSDFVPVGGTLSEVADIDTKEAEKLLAGVSLTAMCDIDNPLYGPTGAAYVFAPQKGADEATVVFLDGQLRALAGVIEAKLGRSVAALPGAGAAGGLGAGMVAFLGAQLRPGIEAVLDLVRFDARLDGCDLVLTGEGRLDTQSVRGKVISGVARHAKEKSVPVVAIVGGVLPEVEDLCDDPALGLTAVFSINRQAMDFAQSRYASRENYTYTLNSILRLLRAAETK